MVLIELDDETQDQNPTPLKPSSSSSNTMTDSAPRPNRDAEEGFETASDGELGDNDSDGDEDHHRHHPQQQPQQHQEEYQLQRQDEHIVWQNDDEELKQVRFCSFSRLRLSIFDLFVLF